MTYIKTIELDNFKSFSGHVKLDFVNGFNIVAGANGSGKSNIIDALMFVFGGASKKEMRSDLLTDLIFNGGKLRSPAESAKVTLTLDNSDGGLKGYEEKEVSISRKIDKSGKSVFRINGKASTREEILNLLSVIKVKQDSFNIIPQGRINDIINASNEERLSLVNEISGISVFEDKKSKAMLEMKKVEDNISKIETVLNEKKKLMEKLQKEKEKASEFADLKARQFNLLAKQSFIKRKAAWESLEKVVNQIKEVESKNQEATRINEEINVKIRGITAEINRINTEAESKGEEEITRTEKLAKELDTNIARSSTVQQTNKEQIEKIEQSLKDLVKSRTELSEELEKEYSDIRSLSDQSSSLEAKRSQIVDEINDAERTLKEAEQVEKDISRLNAELYEAKLALTNYPQLSEFQNQLSELTQKYESLEASKRDYTIKFSSLNPEVEQLRASIKKEGDSIYWLRETLFSQKNQLSSQNKAIDAVNKLKKGINGIHGTVSELFTIKSDEYSIPISRSIGRRGEFIVVDNEDVASECIKAIKAAKMGTFNFIPLNKISFFNLPQKPESDGVIDFTINLVEFGESVSNAMKFVFGDTLLVKDIDTSKGLINKFRLVTMDGTVIEKTGVISGGSFEPFNISSAMKKISDLNKSISERSELKESQEKELLEKESLLGSLMASIKSCEFEMSQLKPEIDSLSRKVSGFSGSEKEISDRIQKLEETIRSAEGRPDVKNSIKIDPAKHKKEIEYLDAQIKEVQLKMIALNNKTEHISKAELSNLNKRIADLEKEKDRFSRDNEELEKTLSSLHSELEKVTKDLDRKSSDLTALRKKRDQLSKETAELNEERDKALGKSKAIADEINKLHVSEAELRTKYEIADEEFKKYSEAKIEIAEGETFEKITKELSSVTSKVNSFGPVNELALETFNSTLTEYNEFSEKLAKVNEEKDRVNQIILEIDERKKEAFTKTLTEINTVFSKVYSSFTNGKAELSPDTPEDMFSGGLDILIDLPNKKVHNVRGLSGGEKSIVALSLILAISRYIDVPFYVLDEVDAALDSLNSSKFSEIARAYSEKTQFIVISHNENTLINSDVIYGVTMTSDGLSKVVSVKLPGKPIIGEKT